MRLRSLLLLALAWMTAVPGVAQLGSPVAANNALGPFASAPTELEILGLSVTGIENEYTQTFVQQTSGLSVGQKVLVPGDPVLGEAVRSIYRLGMFSDVKLVEERRFGTGIYLAIQVTEQPKLAEYEFRGIKKSQRKDLQQMVPLIKRSPMRPGSIERAIQVIEEFYAEKGRPLADVEVEETLNDDNTISLVFQIDPGPKVEVGDIRIVGNERLSERRIRKAMETREDRWWRFWSSSPLKDNDYQNDLSAVIDYYNEKGYYDARILGDTTYIADPDGDPKWIVEIEVEEGNRYFIRDITWEGNTVYRDEYLTQSLGVEPGDAYNSKRLTENLYGNRASTDVGSQYYNLGYMRFNVQPIITVIGDDSLDIHYDVFEGDVYSFGDVRIAGNSKTKEHVIRRELLTVPGSTFNRDAIQESVRRLLQLNFFTQESLAPGPSIDINDADKEVDLEYSLVEQGTDQLELSGTWGRFGLVLQLRFTFNNFSAQNLFKRDAWKPLPSGDGQKFSVGVQTNGKFYQQYSLSFQEPWFRGRPRLLGFSLSFTRVTQNILGSTTGGGLLTASGRVFFNRRLKWPDDKFSSSTSFGYQIFDNRNWLRTLPDGISQEISIRQTISRNSTNHPFFPSSGSNMSLSLEIAPPVGDLIQYHKWRFSNSWNLPLSRKISLGVSADYGLIGSLTGEPVQFERFLVGGSPFETSGSGSFTFFGKDIIYMRGYPLAALGPRVQVGTQSEPVGGRILNKYTSELRWMAIQTEQLTAAPYLFLDAANTWNGFRSYDPAALNRAAGMGVRIFLPILGLVEMAYGYNFDRFDPIRSDNGSKGWSFQFSLGQGFGQ